MMSGTQIIDNANTGGGNENNNNTVIFGLDKNMLIYASAGAGGLLLIIITIVIVRRGKSKTKAFNKPKTAEMSWHSNPTGSMYTAANSGVKPMTTKSPPEYGKGSYL